MCAWPTAVAKGLGLLASTHHSTRIRHGSTDQLRLETGDTPAAAPRNSRTAHQAADVACAVGLASPLCWVLEAVGVCLGLLVPHGVVALVHGVDLANLRDLQVRQHKMTSVCGWLTQTRKVSNSCWLVPHGVVAFVQGVDLANRRDLHSNITSLMGVESVHCSDQGQGCHWR